MFFWLFGTFMMFSLRGENIGAAVFWDRFVYLGVALMPALMQDFSLAFTGRAGQRKLLLLNYLLGVVFVGFSQTRYFVDGLHVYAWGAHSKAQLFHHIFLGYFFLAISIFFVNFWRYYQRLADRRLRRQTLCVVAAFGLVMFVGGTAYLYAYGIDTKFPFAYFTGLTFPVILFYSVIRHQLLATKIIGTEILVAVTNFILMTQVFLSKTITDVILRSTFAILVTAVGILLVRSVRQEVIRREEIARLAESLQRANQRLKELDQLKTEFLSIATHQLRTPLSIIKGYVSLLAEGAYGRLPKKALPILDHIDVSNERLILLVDEFLNVSRIEQGRTQYRFVAFDLPAMIAGVAEELQAKAASRSIAITCAASKRLEVVGDEEKLRHAAYNLVDNAIKYSPNGSTVSVSVSARGTEVLVRVKDAGVGLDAKDKKNLFEKFYRSPHVVRDVQGTGLGLFVVKEFVEGHGGRVWAKSAGIGQGSEFGFSVPKTQ